MPELFDHENGSNLGLNVAVFDAMDRPLGQADLMGKLILAQAQHRPCCSKLGGKRSALNAQKIVELRGV